MAFDRTKLNKISNSLSALPQTFEYVSSDVVTTAGYFPKDEGIKAGDKVILVTITETSGIISKRTDTAYYMIADANGTLTATAFT